MTLSTEEEQMIEDILRAYQNNENIQQLKHYVHHGAVTTYEHCVHVTRASCWINRRLHLNADEEVLLISAFLHDFYLYDWHKGDASHRLHGFFHPDVACRNAIQNFQIGEKEQAIIRSHMWPLTFLRLPMSREAWIVCITDKYCSIVESVLQRRETKNNVGK